VSICDKLRDAAIANFGEPPAPKKGRPCVLKHRGKVIQLLSGKSLWNNPGHAKTALLNHVESTLAMDFDYPERVKCPDAKAMAHEMLADGTVEVVEL
jgi:hypothetical protein